VEVCAKFGRDWSRGLPVKEGHRYKQSVLYIEILANRAPALPGES